MFKIGEFSKITQVSVRMLRYYDEQKLLVPSYTDRFTGYRLYSAQQIEQLNKIIFLRDMGFGVNAMKDLLQNWNPEFVKQNLRLQIEKSLLNIKSEEKKVKLMQGLLSDLENPKKEQQIEITLKSLPMQQVVSMRKIVDDYYCESAMWEEFQEVFREVKGVEKLQCFSIYHDLDYREKDVDIEICVVTDLLKGKEFPNVICRQIPQVDVAACFMIYGDYINISSAYKQFAFWLEQHKEYRMSGENRQICHVSVCDTDNPEDYITELQIPLRIHVK